MNTSGKKKITVNYRGKNNSFYIAVHNVKNALIPAEEYPESTHNYENNLNKMYVYTTQEDAKCVQVKFSKNTRVEDVFDSISIYDQNDKLFGKYLGSELSGKVVTINGNTIKIKLVTDGEGSEYGFKLDSIYVNYIEHEYEQIESIDSTCTEYGKVVYSCKICDRAKEELKQPEHKWESEYTIDKEATCTEKGLKSRHCQNCNEITDTVEIDMLKHIENVPTKENELAPTNTQTGSYDRVIYCKLCGSEMSRIFVKVPKLQHKAGDINDDDIVDIMDVRIILQKVISNTDESWTDYDIAIGDINRDKTLDITDVRILLQKVISKNE